MNLDYHTKNFYLEIVTALNYEGTQLKGHCTGKVKCTFNYLPTRRESF